MAGRGMIFLVCDVLQTPGLIPWTPDDGAVFEDGRNFRKTGWSWSRWVPKARPLRMTPSPISDAHRGRHQLNGSTAQSPPYPMDRTSDCQLKQISAPLGYSPRCLLIVRRIGLHRHAGPQKNTHWEVGGQGYNQMLGLKS